MIGFLNINKQEGMTSFQVIAVLRKIFKVKQIGHAGTLDPLACGVLPVAVGKAARLIEFLCGDKAYICECEFGKTTETLDREGKIEFVANSNLSQDEVKNALIPFLGKIEQLPPVYSAVHYEGKRLYELARKGIVPDDIKKRTIEIYELKLLDFSKETQRAKIFIKCSGGTYIRSLVRDLGEVLKVGAYMTSLLRVEAAGFKIENAVSLDELQKCDNPEKYLINPIDVLSYKRKELNEIEYEKVIHGNSVGGSDEFREDEDVILTKDNRLVAIGQNKSNLIKIRKVFIE